MHSRLFLYRVLRLHVQLASHLVAVIGKKIVVQRFLIASNGTAYAGSMGGEDSTYLGQMSIDVKCAQTAHPLVSMINNTLVLIKIVVVIALHYQTCSVREHRGFVVVAIGMERIDLIVFPKPSINLVFLFEIRLKVHQNSYWLSWNGPSSNTQVQTLFLCLPLPFSKKRLVFLEIGTFLLFPKIRTNKYYPVLHFLL